MFLYFKFLERDGNRGLGLLPLYSLDWIGLDWCEGVPPGAHRTGCLSNASRPRGKTSYLYVQLWHVGYFLVIIAKPTSSCYYFIIFLVFVFYSLAVGLDYTSLTKSFDEISNTSWPLTVAVCPSLLTSTRVRLIRPVVMAS